MYNRAQEPRSKRQLTDNLFMNNLQPPPSTQLTTTGRPMTSGLKLIGLSLILLLGVFAANCVEDQVGVEQIGPRVRIYLDEVVPAGQPVTLHFRYYGALITPEGGPLATKRLAYVGPEGSYLMYAARWFPFHDYAADRATADITIIVPTGIQVAGTSDDPVTPQVSKDGNTRFRFVHRKPVLPGNFVAGQYIARSLRFGNYDIQLYAKVGSENRIENYAELMGTANQ